MPKVEFISVYDYLADHLEMDCQPIDLDKMLPESVGSLTS